jgi:beta-phosphoglucomutase-like phosphatase (HAD superfamily)
LRYSGIIFDFNGTMFFDTDKNEAAWQAFASQYCHRLITAAEFREQAHGRTNQSLLEYLFQQQFSPVEIYELSEKKEVIYREMCLQDQANFHLAPGLCELLDTLRDNQIPRNIATAAQKNNLDFYIQHFQLGKWFDLNLIVYDNGTFPGKPAPDIYRLAADKIGISPAQCIVVEDALSGIRAAQAAGAGKIIAIGPESARDDLLRIEAVSSVIQDFNEFDRSLLTVS